MKKKDLIIAKHVSKVYADTTVVDDVTFTIARGTITAMIGPNAAGKSTLAKIMMGLISATRGSVTIGGQSPHKVRTSIGYVPQRFTYNPKVPVTVREFLRLSLHVAGHHEREEDEVITERFADVGLGDVMHKHLYQLSGGQLQRMLIARALLTDKTLLILDEPVAGVDIEGRKSIYELLKDLKEKHGMTIILISHELDVVFQYADQVLCINRRMLCHGKPQETLTEEVLGEMYGMNHQAHYHHRCSHES
jgi:zinc transport system ATP-binding protein